MYPSLRAPKPQTPRARVIATGLGGRSRVRGGAGGGVGGGAPAAAVSQHPRQAVRRISPVGRGREEWRGLARGLRLRSDQGGALAGRTSDSAAAAATPPKPPGLGPRHADKARARGEKAWDEAGADAARTRAAAGCASLSLSTRASVRTRPRSPGEQGGRPRPVSPPGPDDPWDALRRGKRGRRAPRGRARTDAPWAPANAARGPRGPVPVQPLNW